jgi:hypothetical protein
MTLPLTVDMLRAAYDFLDETPPFDRWNLPAGEDVTFRVVRDPAVRGWHRRENGKHVIAISSNTIGHTINLVATMAHEMIHVHETHSKACGSGEHSAAFRRWQGQVCKAHGFDPKLF